MVDEHRWEPTRARTYLCTNPKNCPADARAIATDDAKQLVLSRVRNIGSDILKMTPHIIVRERKAATIMEQVRVFFCFSMRRFLPHDSDDFLIMLP